MTKATVTLERVLSFAPPATELRGEWAAMLTYQTEPPQGAAGSYGARARRTQSYFLGNSPTDAIRTLLVYMENGGEKLLLDGKPTDVEGVARAIKEGR